MATGVIALGIPIEVAGSDLGGMQFVEASTTLIITRNGATFRLASRLAPESEIVIRNRQTGAEVLAHVVGTLRDPARGQVYGIAFLSDGDNLWRAQFPPADSKNPVRLECRVCKSVIEHPISEIEAMVFQANKELARACESCGAVTIWKPTDLEVTAARPCVPPAIMKKNEEVPLPQTERRAKRRAAIQLTACIRYSGIDTVVKCEDMSRGGFRFRSRKPFQEDLRMEASVPYAKSGENIFMPVRIVYCQELGEGQYRCGVAFIKSNQPPNWER
ncbi:MAG: PilZ domain-containing protein [Candidatus Acidiferrales bacterium]